MTSIGGDKPGGLHHVPGAGSNIPPKQGGRVGDISKAGDPNAAPIKLPGMTTRSAAAKGSVQTAGRPGVRESKAGKFSPVKDAIEQYGGGKETTAAAKPAGEVPHPGLKLPPRPNKMVEPKPTEAGNVSPQSSPKAETKGLLGEEGYVMHLDSTSENEIKAMKSKVEGAIKTINGKISELKGNVMKAEMQLQEAKDELNKCTEENKKKSEKLKDEAAKLNEKIDWKKYNELDDALLTALKSGNREKARDLQKEFDAAGNKEVKDLQRRQDAAQHVPSLYKSNVTKGEWAVQDAEADLAAANKEKQDYTQFLDYLNKGKFDEPFVFEKH